MLKLVTLQQISLVVSGLQTLLCMSNYSNQQIHIRPLNVTHKLKNCYMFQCRSAVCRESKIQSRVINLLEPEFYI